MSLFFIINVKKYSVIFNTCHVSFGLVFFPGFRLGGGLCSLCISFALICPRESIVTVLHLYQQGGKHEEPTGLPPSSTLLHGHHASGPTPAVSQPEGFTSKFD